MFILAVVLVFIQAAVGDDFTTSWPDGKKKSNQNPQKSSNNNQLSQLTPSIYHGILTVEPPQLGIPPPISSQNDPSYRVIGRVRVPGGFANPMSASVGVGRSQDFYGMKEFGQRHGDIMVVDRVEDRYGGFGHGHHRDNVFIPQTHLINEEDKLFLANDETTNECSKLCKPLEWLCPISCSCIPKEKRCDKVVDCERGDDEQECNGFSEADIVNKIQLECESTGVRVMCPKTLRCIAKEWLCDGDDDCGDYSDETHCGAHANCTEDQFECSNGFCVQKTWVCDGDNDCKDFSDEVNCTKITCGSDNFQCSDGYCVSYSFLCDGDQDCLDGSDEQNCQTPILLCPEGEFKCKGGMGGAGGPGGRCVLERFRCDGDNDCGDWSDEENCLRKPSSCTSSEFKCDDGNCVPVRWKCDGEQDCDGGEDEKDCSNVDPNQPKTCGSEEYTCKNGRCILKTWLCDGYPDCSRGEDELDCKISCDIGQFLCPARKNSTNLKICVHQKHVCDGHNDCPNGEDERNCPVVKPCATNSKCEQICVTTAYGKDECACRVGFILHSNGKNCTDIDECQFLTSPVCSQKCKNTYGGFVCSCESGYVLRPDLRSCKALGGAVQLIVANRGDIRKVSLSNNRYTAIIKGLHNAIALDYHYKRGLLFWSDVSTDVIKMVYMNGTKPRDVIKWGLESPGGVAVDWIHDLLFWTDSGTRRVEVSNFQGDLRIVIAANDLDKPRAIVVHPGEAFVFWTDWGPNPKIERAYMDGSERKPIISNGIFWPNGLSIDYTSKRIYWADAKHHVIESANLDGSSRSKILSEHLPHPFALTLFEDTMYWTDWNTKSISAANKVTGKGFRNIHERFHFPMDVHAYHPSRQPNFADRCVKDRRGLKGGCSHLCIPNKSSRRCGCPIGLTLKEDQKTCNSVPDNIILVARRKDIRLRQINSRTSPLDVDMILPLDGLKSTVALDWCSKYDYVYWTDVERSTINRAHLNGSNQESVVHTNLLTPAGLAFDWVTDKLYWTDADTNRIEVASSNGKARTLLVWQNIDKPRDIAVNPIDGLMFWSDWGVRPMIERAGMDGSGRKVLVSENIHWPNGLAIDYDNNKLYFVDGGTKNLEYINFDGTGRNSIIKSGLEHPFGLDVNGNSVFWTDWDTKSVEMADKFTGKNRKTIISNTSDLMDVRVFHRNRRHLQNPCSVSNGDCSHLCLLKPQGYSCACPTGIKLMENLRTCEDGPSSYIIFAHRTDIRQISLDIDHFIDIVLPLPPIISNAMSVDVDLKTGMIYWTDNVEDVIMAASPNGTTVLQIVGESLDSVDGHAIDSIGRKIYWTDAGRHTIEVCELDGRNRHVLAWQDLNSPRGIALDYNEGIMFWSDWESNPKIERADMDGAHRSKIITTDLGWPNCLSIDIEKKRLYWTDAKRKHIESSNYRGHDRKVIVSSLQHPYGISVTTDFIYWTDWKTKALHMVSKKFGSAQKTVIENIDGLMDVKVVKNTTSFHENVCGNNNGNCSHLCLRNPTGYSCKCPTGISLRKGSKTECNDLPENYLLVALRSGIGMISLDTQDFMDVVLPISGVHGAVVLDYHYNQSKLFFADVNLDVIRSVDLLNPQNTKTVISSGLITPNGIAVDWLANNLYWSDTDMKVIEVARFDGSCRKAIMSKDLADPRSLILYPRRGFIFWSDWGGPPRIERCLMDGSERKVIVDSNLGYPSGLAIDFEQRRLYWADALQDRVEMADFDGKKRKIVIPHATHPFGVTLYESFVFWTDWYNKSVFRASLSSSSNAIEIRHSLSGALDIRSVSSKRQPKDYNPCAYENGGCSHLCLFKGKSYSCACPDKPDNRICKLEPAFVVPQQTEDVLEYPDEITSQTPTDDEYKPEYPLTQDVVITGCVIVTILLVLVVTAILVLIFKSRKKRTKRSSAGPSRSVLTFANPNYNVADGTPMEPKTTIWKRWKYDRSQERVCEERMLTTETASSSLFVVSSSPTASPSTPFSSIA